MILNAIFWLRLKKKYAARTFCFLMLLVLPSTAQAQFTFTTNNNQITISGYTGSGGSVIIPSTTNGMSVVGISDNAFSGKSAITSVYIPSSVVRIGQYAFYGCYGLTSVTIGINVTNLGDGAFIRSGLTSVVIPNSVTTVGGEVFYDCYNLTNITVMANNLNYSSVNGVLFDKAQATLIQFPGGLGGSYTIPHGVTTIGEAAFEDCIRLKSATIPKSVVSIGGYAFYGCNNLTSAYFMGNAPSADYTIFSLNPSGYYDPVTIYYLPGTAGWWPTFGNYGLIPVLWNPQAQTNDSSFGVQTNQFGFNITGSSGLIIVVQACTNLANPVWLPVATNILTSGISYFSDPQWMNYSGRFYRLCSP